mgnify:CR=1 FL=1
MDEDLSSYKRSVKPRRFFSVLVLALAVIAGMYLGDVQQKKPPEAPATIGGVKVESANEATLSTYNGALAGLHGLAVKGRAPKTGYARAQFGNGWEKSGTCDTRNRILARDLTAVTFEVNSCIVLTGSLQDPYTGKLIPVARGQDTSSDIQIDHVVALSDAWQKGAQLLAPALRVELANDGLELLAVDGPANQQKGDGDAATWLPSNKPFRCAYVARQVSVKLKYSLWVTAAEKTAIERILKNCPSEPLPK